MHRRKRMRATTGKRRSRVRLDIGSVVRGVDRVKTSLYIVGVSIALGQMLTVEPALCQPS